MPTTTNNGWTTPADTDLVKDGAAAIRTLGNAIDSTLGVYSSAGMSLVTSATIGSGVSSVTVSSAFNTNYDAYRIIVIGGVGSANNAFLTFQLGSASTAYYSALSYVSFAGATSQVGNNNGSVFNYMGAVNTTGVNASIEVLSPFLTANTMVNASFHDATNCGRVTGFLSNSTSYTAFTIAPNTGTLTGGKIYVYGYKK